MKKIILILISILSFSANGQVSRNRLKNPIYSWPSRTVPTAQYQDSTWASFYNKINDPSVGTGSIVMSSGLDNYWSKSGNAVASNTAFIGTTDNRSLLFKTNNIDRLKIDSVGKVIINGTLAIGNAIANTTYTYSLLGDDIQIITPINYSNSGNPSKLVIFCHGNGGTYTQIGNTTLRDSLLANGFAFATASAKQGFGSGNGWGNNAAQSQYINLYNFCRRNFNVSEEVYLFGASMGGLVSINLIKSKAFPIAKYVGLYNAISLDSMYRRGTHGTIFTSGIEAAYNFSGLPNLTKSTFGNDPFKRIRITGNDSIGESFPPTYFIHGSADTIASYPTALNYYKILKNSNQNITLKTVAGGVHSSSIPSSADMGIIMNWIRDTYTYTDSYTTTTYNYFKQNGTALTYTGNVNIGNANMTGQRVLRVGQGTGWTDIGNATDGTGNGFISFNQSSNSLANGALYGGAFSTNLNSNNVVGIRVNNSSRILISDNTQLFSPASTAAGTATPFQFNLPDMTNQTGSIESIQFLINSGRVTRQVGNQVIQRNLSVTSPTYAFDLASTVTTAVNVEIQPPFAGTNATFLNNISLQVVGNASITGAGYVKSIIIKNGTNAKAGQSTLVSGSVVVANTSVLATSIIVAVGQGTVNAGSLTITQTAATGFTITSSNALDTRTVNWVIFDQN